MVGVVLFEGKKKMMEKVKGFFGGLKKGYYYDDDDIDMVVSFGVGNILELSLYGIENMGYGLDFNEGGKEDCVLYL